MNAPVKAYITTEVGDHIPCLFNPAELTIQKTSNWEAPKSKGKDTPKLRFQEGFSGQITLDLTMDTTTTEDPTKAMTPVTRHTDRLLGLMRVDLSLKGTHKTNNSGRPPWCQFHWGDFHSFKAVVASLSLKFTYFASDGTPLRAKATITLKQYEPDEPWESQNPTSITPSPHVVHHVLPGETLDRIAALRYGDPSRWRLIADANDVVDPLQVPPGTPLVLPELEAVRRG